MRERDSNVPRTSPKLAQNDFSEDKPPKCIKCSLHGTFIRDFVFLSKVCNMKRNIQHLVRKETSSVHFNPCILPWCVVFVLFQHSSIYALIFQENTLSSEFHTYFRTYLSYILCVFIFLSLNLYKCDLSVAWTGLLPPPQEPATNRTFNQYYQIQIGTFNTYFTFMRVKYSV